MHPPTSAIPRSRIDGAVFDLDGVLTDTARIHASAWQDAFDAFLRRRSQRTGDPFVPFDPRSDYLAHVDGKPRRDGVRAFLASRGIKLPEGGPDDPPDADTVEAIAQAKDTLLKARLPESVPMPGTVDLLSTLRAAGVRIAVASSSANCAAVLAAAGLDHFVEARVDGVVAREFGLPGKPDPAIFLEALHRIGVPAGRAAVFEDALAGIDAGRRAGFALVIGVGRGPHAAELRSRGADAVVDDLSGVSLA